MCQTLNIPGLVIAEEHAQGNLVGDAYVKEVEELVSRDEDRGRSVHERVEHIVEELNRALRK